MTGKYLEQRDSHKNQDKAWLFASETWQMAEANNRKLDAFHHRGWLRIFDIY